MPRAIANEKAGATGKRRLRWLLGLFFITLAIPSAILTWQAYSRLTWERFHQYQLLAEDLLTRIDRRLRDLVEREEGRAFTDYRFLVVEGAPAANYLQRSPLAGFPVRSDVPGLLGYFQLDADGRFTTPLLPDDPAVSPLAYGISDPELRQRQALRERLLAILSQDASLAAEPPRESDTIDRAEPSHDRAGGSRREAGVERSPASDAALHDQAGMPLTAREAPANAPVLRSLSESTAPVPQAATQVREKRLAQAAFDRLSEESAGLRKAEKRQSKAANIGRVDELELDQTFDADHAALQSRRPLPRFRERVEYDAVRDLPPAAPARSPVDAKADATGAAALVRMFESEVDPFELGLAGADHFVLFRKVWRGGRRHIQGAVIDRTALVRELFEARFRDSALAGMSRLGIVFEGAILSALAGARNDSYPPAPAALSGTLLYRGRLSPPLDRMELVFTVTRIPSGAAGSLVIWVSLTLGLVLSGGLFLMYRLGAKQIELNQQQRDFVSAVSHELKTPLTSIRMYSEMLREGWADEERRSRYYAFIHDESERLSRLITNVLQLARMSRDELRVELRTVTVSALIDVLRSKIASQVEHAGFTLDLRCAPTAAHATLAIDDDAFTQIMINLVDNAIKFSARATQRVISVGAGFGDNGRLVFTVRDRGPGIPRDQLKQIFRLFYRSESELTRETVGTGIGLALVHRLTTAMGGKVDVVNRDPGAEFRLDFPVQRAGSAGAAHPH